MERKSYKKKSKRNKINLNFKLSVKSKLLLLNNELSYF